MKCVALVVIHRTAWLPMKPSLTAAYAVQLRWRVMVTESDSTA